jgi:hypothetical protein
MVMSLIFRTHMFTSCVQFVYLAHTGSSQFTHRGTSEIGMECTENLVQVLNTRNTPTVTFVLCHDSDSTLVCSRRIASTYWLL